ncbi:Ribonucleotide reductase inhibitor [Botryosphaeria dothidea]|uniref:Ribonucleotide reductase inhibitor n=1 Tax=Botryosphaeria dothidea TaxID=55169 RepID=A0A8H4N1R7_9PEZI|nr:Ribonucleotide reductase inhibitor [Botryosphaeria dothidea]
MSASAHRNKRPFQPSITSYFTRADRPSSSDPDAAPRNAAPPQGLAAVPANVQASLLNVGMRVRKSVPEGYKTHKTLPPNPGAASPYANKTPPNLAPARPAELLPFCGLHKTGGYQQQQPYAHVITTAAAAPHPVSAFGADDFALLLSSQESNASTLSTDSLPAPATNKRRYDDEEEEEEEEEERGAGRPLFPSLNTSLAVPSAGDDDDLQISPRTKVYPVSHTAMPDLDAPTGRRVARPKSRMREGVCATASDRRLAVGEEGVFDFGEAEFLRPPQETGEVEMGGV